MFIAILNMNLFARDTSFRTITFDAEELHVIRTACVSRAEHDRGLLIEAANAGLDQYLYQVKAANISDMTVSLVTLFKPELEILIEPEDLEPITDSLEFHRSHVSGEYAIILERAIRKIETCLS